MKLPARRSLFVLFILVLLFIPLLTSPEPAKAGTYDCSSQSDIPQAQCEALVSFYNSTDGDNSWTTKTGWLSTATPCDDWYGVSCQSGNVTGISLEYNNLTGPLPSNIGDLSYLRGLSLTGNNLSGAIPAGFYSLIDLYGVDLSDNELTGSLSESIADLDDVVWLDLWQNQFSGSLPTDLGDMDSLQYLRLQNNSFENSIPTSLGSVTGLVELDLSDNNLSGSIPTELGSLVNLGYLQLQNNNLSGSIPSSLGSLSLAIWFNLSNNSLTGNIPSSISGLISTDNLNLSNNQLEGSIPAELATLTTIVDINLSQNSLTGSLPTAVGDMDYLEFFNVSHNQLSGSIPDQFGWLDSLSWMDLSNNSFSGALNSWFPDTAIEYLYYQNTNFCTPIESEFQTWLAGITDYGDSGIDCPGAAVLQSPQYSTFDTDPTFTWLEAVNAVDYRLYITWVEGTVHNAWHAGADVCTAGTCTYNLGFDLEPGTYTWYVQTRNSATSGPWDGPMWFEVLGPDPINPTGTISEVTPDYDWYEWEGADEYRLFVSHAAVGTVINEYWYQSELICESMQCSVTSNVHLRTGNHSWAFQARNDSRTIDEWSDWGTFKLLNSTPPDEAIVPVSPTGGETTDVNPTYTWNAVERASWYKIFVGSQTTGKVYNAYHRAAEVCYGVTCDVTPTDYLLSGSPVSSLEYATEFNWYVMPINVAGNGSFSSAQNFVTRP